MNDSLSATLSPHASHWMQWYADVTGRPVSQVIGDTVEQIISAPAEGADLSGWSDEVVLAAADSTMPVEAQRQMQVLLEKQDQGLLSSAERKDLDAMTRICQVERLRKAHALAEAVRRGLRGPFK